MSGVRVPSLTPILLIRLFSIGSRFAKLVGLFGSLAQLVEQLTLNQ